MDFEKVTAESLGISLPPEFKSNVIYYVINKTLQGMQLSFNSSNPALLQVISGFLPYYSQTFFPELRNIVVFNMWIHPQGDRSYLIIV